jgi:8-hydroxy-5-deazaflavin:NADPH oxidoreductase
VKIAIIGAGRIGRGIARQLAASHELMLSFSRHPEALEKLTGSIGTTVAAGTPAQAAGFGEVVVVSVPWGMIPLALQEAGPLEQKIVIDTTNQFGPPPLPAEGETAAQFNAARMPGHVMPSRSTPSPPPSRPSPRAAPVRRGWCSGCAATTPGPRRWSPA